MPKKRVSPVLIKDPNAEIEAQKYDNPVPSREALISFLESQSSPITHAQLCSKLGEKDEERVEALRRRLIAMVRDGQIFSNRKQQFIPMSKADLVTGRVAGHKDGFGFLLRDNDADIILSNRQMRKVFHGDLASVQIVGHDRKGRPEGRIVKVLEHHTKTLVGRFYDQSGVGVVQPDNKRLIHDVIIPKEHQNKASQGQFVVVELIEQPSERAVPVGKVIEVLGEHLAPGMEIDVAIRSHNIPYQWPEAVIKEADNLPEEVAEKDKLGRIDLRHLPFVTIDGEDAKDFDDAVYCEKNKRTGGYRLYVAIADVSHYVKPKSALDEQAQERGNSVYFPEHVIPMLPEKLSNGLCSLNPLVDRLVLVCEMTVSAAGRISSYKFMQALIHSHARLTYNLVWDMLQSPVTEKGEYWRGEYAHIVEHIDDLYQLYGLLRARREERGAMDFDSVETRIVFDAQRKIQEILPVHRNPAHMLIEECMLAANVCAADIVARYKVPAMYRVHPTPSDEKLEKLMGFLAEIGLSLGAKKPTPKDYQALLQKIQSRVDAHLIQTVMLRSMSQAVYEPENKGHFGLAYKAYTHFTSPIRRYPDLLIHRAITSLIRSEQDIKHVRRAQDATSLNKNSVYPYCFEDMVHLGEQCSLTERRADDATRDVMSFLKCEYIKEHIGEKFEGVISAVTGFGLFVELKDIYIEGLIHIANLPGDYYNFDAMNHRLVGERSRRTFRLGDSVLVQVAGVDIDERNIDFELTSFADFSKKTTKKKQANGAKKLNKKVVTKSKSSKPSAQSKKSPKAKKSAKKTTAKNKKRLAKSATKKSKKK